MGSFKLDLKLVKNICLTKNIVIILTKKLVRKKINKP